MSAPVAEFAEVGNRMTVTRNGITVIIRRPDVGPDDWLAEEIARCAMYRLGDLLDRLAEVRKVEAGK